MQSIAADIFCDPKYRSIAWHLGEIIGAVARELKSIYKGKALHKPFSGFALRYLAIGIKRGQPLSP